MKKTLTLSLLCALSLTGFAVEPPVLSTKDSAVLTQIEALNKIPETQLDEKQDPTLSILRTLIDLDGPEFLRVRKLAAMATVRGPLTPGTRALLAELISPRWDVYAIAGNLWLSALRTPNTALREKARRKMVQFIQPPHIPELIRLLADPVAGDSAYDILKEVTNQELPQDPKVWSVWWAKNKTTLDIVGVLLKSTRARVMVHAIPSFESDKLWYVPDGLRDKALSYKNRTPQEQDLIRQWNGWANAQVHIYADNWASVKPVIERITHHPDPRVNKFLESLLADPAYGDYAALVLAWRQNVDSLGELRSSYAQYQTVGRALGCGSLGDTDSLVKLLQMIDHSGLRALSYGIMEDDLRARVTTLKSVGILPAEEAFELLCHRNFGFAAAETGKEKRKRMDKATEWLKKNASNLIFDSRRGYFTVAPSAR
jgi:hypothetical protein